MPFKNSWIKNAYKIDINIIVQYKYSKRLIKVKGLKYVDLDWVSV